MESFHKCLDSLKSSTSDNERLAALMVIGKICAKISAEEKITDLFTEDLINQLFNAVTPAYLLRLIKSTSNYSNNNTFQTIAFNMLSFFAKVSPELYLKDEELIKIVFVFLKKSKTKCFYKDCLDILSYLVKSEKVIKLILQNSLFSQLEHLILLEEYTNSVIQILKSALSYGSKLDEDFILYLESISKLFATNQELLKFQYLQIISKLFQIMVEVGKCISYREDGLISVLRNVTLGCKDILQSRVKVDLKRSVLMLLSNAIKVFGNEWIFDKKCVEGVYNFILLSLTVISLETNIMLHEATNGENLKEEGTIGDLLHIAQEILIYICSDSFEMHDLSSDSNFILKMFNAFRNIMMSIYEYIGAIDLNADLCLDNFILLSSISMLALWATEETSNLRQELQLALPVLMKLAEKEFQEIVENKKTPIIIDIIAPCISQLLPDEKMRQTLISNHCHQMYVKYISFILSNNINNHNETLSGIKTECFESLLHMVHQFTILDPLLCNDTIFCNLSTQLLDLLPRIAALGLNSYSCVEFIAAVLALVRICKIQYSVTLENAIKISIQCLYDQLENCVDYNLSQMWIIAMQNVIACFSVYHQLAENFKDIKNDWNGIKDVPEEVESLIAEFITYLSI